MVSFHGELNKHKFWINWFGLFGRELGTNKSPRRNWTDNPNDLVSHAMMCAEEHEEKEFCRPCWISVQPMKFIREEKKYGMTRLVGNAMAIEKLFYDFDDGWRKCPCGEEGMELEKCPKCGKKLTKKYSSPRLELVAVEVSRFLNDVKSTCRSKRFPFDPEPFIVQTRKGYHVYFWLRQVFQFNQSDFGFAKEVYKELQEMITSEEYEFLDKRVIGDLNRFARVPLTPHEKTGKICQVVGHDLLPAKIRNLEFYRVYGIPVSLVKKSIKIIKRRRRERAKEEQRRLRELEQRGGVGNIDGKFQGKIRPCFQKRMDAGEMKHDQRLAWLFEIYYAGHKTEEAMVEQCKCFNDFKDKTSRKQVVWFLENEKYVYPPYRCKTIMGKGWCLGEECPIFMRKYK